MSARVLWRTMLVLTVIGLGVATYLTVVHYAHIKPLCGRSGHNSCNEVQHSQYSELAGISVAVIGLAGYIVILGSLLAPEGERSRFATVALTLTGFGFSAYLTYRELFSLEKICEWCVSSAVIMTFLVALAIVRFLRADDRHAGAPPRAPAVADIERAEGSAPLGAPQR
jgi:uncharacterized membrane protein